jgi:hypothetical protein
MLSAQATRETGLFLESKKHLSALLVSTPNIYGSLEFSSMTNMDTLGPRLYNDWLFEPGQEDHWHECLFPSIPHSSLRAQL